MTEAFYWQMYSVQYHKLLPTCMMVKYPLPFCCGSANLNTNVFYSCKWFYIPFHWQIYSIHCVLMHCALCIQTKNIRHLSKCEGQKLLWMCLYLKEVSYYVILHHQYPYYPHKLYTLMNNSILVLVIWRFKTT